MLINHMWGWHPSHNLFAFFCCHFQFSWHSYEATTRYPHPLQQLENLGLVKTLPLLRAFEYSEMLVTLMLCLVSRRRSMISGSMLFYVPREEVTFKFTLWPSSRYCWLAHIRDCFLAGTSKTEGSSDSMTGLLIWAFSSTTYLEAAVI